MSMNRQLRRAQDKQDRKQEKAKAERREERMRRVRELQAQRDQRRKTALKAREGKGDAGKSDAGKTAGSGAAAGPKRGQRDPGRFAGALAIATVVFIVLQGVAPQPVESMFDSFIKAAFYLMFGYFFTMWLYRRNTPSATLIALISGVILAAGSWLGTWLRDSPQDLLALALTVPLLLAGIWLGRLVSTQPQ